MDVVRFDALGICPEIQRAVKHMGFEEASPIQRKAIPVMIRRDTDLFGQEK